MKGSIYEDDYHHEHLQNMVDNMNLLYVAFTRASRGLFVIAHRDKETFRSYLIESVLSDVEKTLSSGNVSVTLSNSQDEDILLNMEPLRLRRLMLQTRKRRNRRMSFASKPPILLCS